MLQLISIYIAKVVVCCAFLFSYYCIVLRNKRFHYYNRFYLLFSVVLSLTVPLLNVEWLTFESSNAKVIRLFNVMYQSEPSIVTSNQTFFNNWQQIIIYLLIAVTLLMLLSLAFRIIKLYRFKKIYPVKRIQECDFISTDLSSAPFSFFRNIFWRSDISLEETTGQQILQHELTHIRQHHTSDKLVIQIIASIFWMNPFYWLIKRELYMIHEFIADEKAVQNHDTSVFAQMLLHAQFGESIFTPANSFFYSPIKRRLIMLTTSKELRFSYARRIIALPLLASVVLLFSFRLKGENTLLPENKTDKINFTGIEQVFNTDTVPQKKAEVRIDTKTEVKDTVIEIRVNEKTGKKDTAIYIKVKAQPNVHIVDTVKTGEIRVNVQPNVHTIHIADTANEEKVYVIDAAPPKVLGYLDNKPVIKAAVNSKTNIVTLTFQDKTTKQISAEEARKNNIKIPPPPPPPVPQQ